MAASVNLVIFFFSLLLARYLAEAKVAMNWRDINLHLFDDIEADFAPKAKRSGELGILYLAEPVDACRALANKAEQLSKVGAPFVLMVRGGCSSEGKVIRAQKAGFKAAIIYDNEHHDDVLVAMAGNNSDVIDIPAVFVTKASGELLKKYAGSEIWIMPNVEYSAIRPIMELSLVCLIAISVGVVYFYLLWRAHVTGLLGTSSTCEFQGMRSHLVNAIPSLIFTSVLEDNCSSPTCAICLEDYSIGEKLRILPCLHKFHATCVDTWLTLWRSFCPVCKRDVKTGLPHPPPSESTHLLSMESSI